MKIALPAPAKILFATLLGIVATSGARADVVYSDATTDLNIRFNPGLVEVGDEIVLAGGARQVTNFQFQYWGLNFGSTEKARIRFYVNDGTNSPAGPQVPNSVLYDSDWFPIVATPRNTLIFDDFNDIAPGLQSVTVPDSFTWSVQFKDLAGGATAGVDLYDPPTVGGNYNEYWDNNGAAGWQYRGTNSPNINFAAKVSAIPEPTIIGLGLLGGLGLLVLRNRVKRR
ncbi:MAG: hypothetical protein EXS35_01505 [Pedosphaera sp.]|nr:hypothetical protein [Pedosphaera sp.]